VGKGAGGQSAAGGANDREGGWWTRGGVCVSLGEGVVEWAWDRGGRRAGGSSVGSHSWERQRGTGVL